MREKLKKWWRGFVDKQKLAVLDGDDGSTKWYMYISPARMVTGLVMMVLAILTLVVVLVAYTPLMDTIPGYPGRRSREALIASVTRLDSLEREMANLTVYSDNIGIILEGKTPVIRDVKHIGDSIQMQDKTMVPRGAADSALRARLEGTGPWSLSAAVASSRSHGVRPDLVLPAKGIVGAEFSPVGGRFGVEIVTSDRSPVVAAREGTVILNVWAPDEGYIVQIQHADNLVSVYRRMSEAIPSVGTRVKAGEIIGIAGPLVFELWYNGTAIDPVNYIIF
jgi:murein DD-endopeptidase MepM/ murein hydrolase activator NlpD